MEITRVGNFFSWPKLLTIFAFIYSQTFVSSLYAAPKAELISYWNVSDEKSSTKIDHSSWQSILDKYLDEQHSSGINRFNYSAVSTEDGKTLEQYLIYLQSIDPRKLRQAQQFPFWVNLYNAKTVALVTKAVKTRDIESIKEIRSHYIWAGPWRMNSLKVAEKAVSLDDIEHGVLRPIWKDRRIHFAVSCASLGCPNLLKTAFTEANTETLLSSAEKSFLLHPRAVRITGEKLVLSTIFQWYRADFAEDERQLLDYVSRFSNLDINHEEIDVSYEYDWGLNSPTP